jgi:hypothetical protein
MTVGHFTTLMAICFLAAACGAQPQLPRVASGDHVVMEVVLRDLSQQHPGPLVVEMHTSQEWYEGVPSGELTGHFLDEPVYVPPALARELERLGPVRQALDPEWVSDSSLALVEAKPEHAEVLASVGYLGSRFRDVFPGARGVVRFSRVAYDEEGRLALLYVSINCGVLCGEDVLYLLERDGSEWTVSGRCIVSVS